MTLDRTDTVVDRARRVQHGLNGTGDPRTVRATVDGPCPNEACGTRVVVEVHADTTSIECPGCGGSFPV